MSYLAEGFANVDSTGNPEKFADCLKLLMSLPYFQRYKHMTFDLLQLAEGDRVLEVGCGGGEDAIALAGRVGATGRVVALDSSREMLCLADQNAAGLNLPVQFVLADAQDLPFADASFQAARVDRTLQHIREPQRVVAEMARVVAAGGRVVAMEPDWETFIVDSDDRALTRTMLNYWCDGFTSGWVGRYLSAYFAAAGLVDIQISPETLVIRKLELADKVFDLYTTARRVQEAGRLDSQQAQGWLARLEQLDRDGQFFCAFTGFVVSGTKPQPPQ
ncbi:class I SAM-dependent methyltransferase [Gloeobacter morelensis]|uniref:Class I SAM-dependent methyltransferase n=1 Tax=Gloeobacter morelensis MG652769 TaxID=2781736 RepID=A0ABY3PHP5_9CYAN|nr:class I SAM-dependent methyltransferase [Gloeobacter morelensis]UFP93175.1 class I SAM-dependent methyltransferase [Gloeobacter morelensis MG652769]